MEKATEKKTELQELFMSGWVAGFSVAIERAAIELRALEKHAEAELILKLKPAPKPKEE